ncbi:MAG: hypothetical protein IKZ39_02525 [Lachnospiraceae bacterium]|nr:hypothetical protein [Lachnospiraceae bacterium]
MKRVIIVLALSVVLLSVVSSCRTKRAVLSVPVEGHVGIPGQEYSATTFLVMYDSVVGKAPLLQAICRTGAEVKYDYRLIHGMAICKPQSMTLEETMAYFRKVKGVISVEYDRIVRLTDPVCPRMVEK